MQHRIGRTRRRGGVFAVGAMALLVAATAPAWSQPGSNPVERPAAVAAQVDADPTVSIAATDPNAAEPGTDTGTFTITRTGDLTQALVVGFRVESGSTASAGTDYETLTGPLTITAGSATGTLTVTPKDDALDEADETVVVTITAPAGYGIGTSATATVTIADNDLPVVTVTASDASASESGGDPGQFTVTREGVTSGPLTVTFSVGGSAEAGSDYSALGSSVVIATGQKSAVIPVAPIPDDDDEPGETVILTVTAVAGANYRVGSPAQATVTIADDDLPTVTVVASDSKAEEDGLDQGRFTVGRSGDTSGALTVKYGVTGTATSGSDYTVLSGSVVIAAGKKTAEIAVVPIDDTIEESDETVILTLSADPAYTIGKSGSATVTIEDDDEPVATPVAAPSGTMPADKDACKKGGWMTFGVFKNQGDCVSWVATGGKNPPALAGSPTAAAGSTTPAPEPRPHPGKGKGLAKKNK